jgi:alpha-tubulin suppressor-like RCC1 family protein
VVASIEELQMAVAAENFTAVLSEEGALYVMGEHPLRGVPMGPTPERMDGPRDAVALVAAGGLANQAHAGIVTVAGDLWMYSCGGGGLGPSMLGRSLVEGISGTPMDRALFGNDKVLMVTCGNDHAAVLTEGGAVYTLGQAADGRLGHGDEHNKRQKCEKVCRTLRRKCTRGGRADV